MASSLPTKDSVSKRRPVADLAKSGPGQADQKPRDPNMSDPRLFVNRPCVYERRLPGDAYITAHVQRLQHGFYASASVSDIDAEYVDFLAISFVFHSPHTLTHRFKSATIRAAICGGQEMPTSAMHPHGYPPGNPHFLMHAPHLIFGTVSPETMQWTFSLAGSLGISEAPVSASIIPSGSVSKQFRRYEMMRIQGSARTMKSTLGPEFDVEAGEIVWSLEENNLQRSGLPCEFTFIMLIQKPTADTKIKFTLNIEPVLQTWYGNYPNIMLSLPAYQPQARRSVDFRREVGQRFEPADAQRGFNFAALENSFDHYIAMPGRKFTRSIEIPPENSAFQNNGLPGNNFGQNHAQYGNGQNVGRYGGIDQYTSGQYITLNPVQALQNEGFSFRDNFTSGLLQSQLHQSQAGGGQSGSTTNNSGTSGLPSSTGATSTLNVRLFLDNYAAAVPPAPSSRVRNLYANVHDPTVATISTDSDETTAVAQGNSIDETAGRITHLHANDESRARVIGGKVYEEEVRRPPPRRLRSASTSEASGSVMMLANVPLTNSLLFALAGNLPGR
ncbi:hypothetical protein N7486_009595 [Penicillium sp. IBT 16267x]|nr:hypothetical protein N7486_009595 [Penicillium sp. IBT 16267x]